MFELAVSFIKDCLLPAFEHCQRRHIADGAVQANEVLEVFGDELRPVVRDDSGCHAGVLFATYLNNDFDIDLLHFFTNVPMDDTAAESIKDRGHEVECPGDVEVRDIDVPVFMSHERLLKSGTLFRSLIVPFEQSGVTEDPIDGGCTAGDHIGINHHVRQASIACERMIEMELQDGLLFPLVKPMITRNPAVVLEGSTVVFRPAAIRRRPDSDPLLNLSDSDFRFLRPLADVIDHLIAYFMALFALSNPATCGSGCPIGFCFQPAEKYPVRQAMARAFEKVRRALGAPGVDRQTIADFQSRQWEALDYPPRGHECDNW